MNTIAPGIEALEEAIINPARSTLDDDDDSFGKKYFPLGFCNRMFLRKTEDATGFGMNRMGNGVTVMSMVFLGTALISFASNEQIEFLGLKPSSLVTAIGTASGLLSAIMLPFMGALVDGTPHRKRVGIIFTFILIVMQIIQMGMTQENWYYMALLQAVNGFIFQVTTLAAYSYLPEMARDIGERRMTKYSSKFFIMMFALESIYLIVVIGVSIYLKLNDTDTGRMALGINVLLAGSCYIYGWDFLTHKKGNRDLSGKSLCKSGFLQVFRTASGIGRHYKSSLGWYLFAVMFAEAGTSTLTLVSVSYLKEAIGFGGTEIGIMFFIVIVCTIPGSALGAMVTYQTNPATSMKIQLVFFMIVNCLAFTVMRTPGHEAYAYNFGILWGVCLGWFYPTESLIFSIIMPKGQEAELAGFFLYCTQIIGWLPPLIFTVLNENDISLNLAGMHLNIYLAIALFGYCRMVSWDDCIEASNTNKMLEEEATANKATTDIFELQELS